MSIDLSKFILHSGYSSFKNNTEYSGSFQISGTAGVGLNTRTASTALSAVPDMADILFNGRADTGFSSSAAWPDGRPSGGWFKQGYVYVRGDNGGAGYTNYPTVWRISAEISGSTITFTARCRLDFLDPLTLTAETVSWKLVDYSVFP